MTWPRGSSIADSRQTPTRSTASSPLPIGYARSVHLDGRDLGADDFKARPEGHTGGALNMVPAYVGYLTANALSRFTRGWLMGQGHCVAAIDAVNVLVGNMSSEHASRYDVSDQGLTRDFYSYALTPDGYPESPLGSHVNAHTAGGLAEGGYLGFAELEYVHMPLPGERLVTFLSDGAFEEQRGSDWAPRWWRAEDCDLVAPIMIANGRRIDQRTTTAQLGGVDWLRDHLRLNGFDPIDVDGRDPADVAWSIVEMDERLESAASAIARGDAAYPVRLPYVIAETTKEGLRLSWRRQPVAACTKREFAQRLRREAYAMHGAMQGGVRAALSAFGGTKLAVTRGRWTRSSNASGTTSTAKPCSRFSTRT